MGTIFIRELRAYFHSFFGWLFVAVYTAFCSLFMVYINFYNGVVYLSRTINSMVVILMFIFPLLTMRIIAGEKRNKTDQLLLTSPVKVTSIVFGKFLSLVTILVFSNLVLFLGILIMSGYGETPFKESILSVLSLILFGAMLAAIGVFMSSITEHQFVAAILTYGAYIFFWFVPQLLRSYFATNAFVATISKSIDILAPFEKMFSGILNLKDVFYVLSVIAISLILSIRVFGKNSLEASLVGARKFFVTTAGIVVSIIAIIVANVLIGRISDKYTQFDFTKMSYFSITQNTKNFLKDLDQDVTIHILSDPTHVDGTLKVYLEQYEAHSKHIKLKYHPLTTEPSFYIKYTNEQPSEGSVIVECGSRFRIIDSEDYYITSYSFDQATYQYVANLVGVDMEGQLTAAISRVLSDKEYKVYNLVGHSEGTLSQTTLDQMSRAGFTVEDLSLLSENHIPEDCDILIVNSPLDDLPQSDCQLIQTYMNNGGSAVFIASLDICETVNYDALISSFGARVTEGIIWDKDASYTFQGIGYYLIPDIVTHQITDRVYAKNKANLFIQTRGFELVEEDPDVSVEALYASSESSIIATTDEEGYLQEKEGTEGAYAVACYCEKYGKDATAKAAIFGSYAFLEQEPDEFTSYANTEVVVDSMCFMCDMSLDSAVPYKSYEASPIVMPVRTVAFLGIILVIIIPLAEIAAGIAIVLIRKNK